MQGWFPTLGRAASGLVLAWSMVSSAHADFTPSFSGYGTVGGTRTSDDEYAFVHDPTEYTGATHQFDVGLESRIGVQAILDFGSGFSVTVQELARQRGSAAFDLGTEWAFLQYSPDPDWKFRLGRVALATFLYSDSREVGYAAPWFRAPNELYGSETLQYLDGAEALWHHNFGAVRLGLLGSYGSTQEDYQVLIGGVETASRVDIKDASNLGATLEFGDFLFRVAQTKLSVPSVSIPLSPTFSVTYTLKDTFNSAGLQFDDGKAIVLSEYAKRSENDVPGVGLQVEASREWYVAGGWRFGKFTPLAMYGKFEPHSSVLFPQGNYGTWSGSLRYDVVRNVALKAQLSRPQAGNPTYWVVPNPGSSERVNVYSVGADFVF